MKRLRGQSLLALVQSFFCEYLRRTRGASEHTVNAYRDTLRMFFVFLADQRRRSIENLQLEDLCAESVLAFLDYIESIRGNSAVTRNCRLAALRSFGEHLLRHDITRAEQYGRILAIPAKRAATRLISYIEPEDMRAVIAAAEGQAPAQRRDRALLLLLYNTGARISEALALRPRDFQLEKPWQVRVYGKGKKERVCPLWGETVAVLREIPLDPNSDKQVFRNSRGAPLTRDGAAYVIQKYVSHAAKIRPALRRFHVTPHTFRHSCAVALLQAGVDVTVIRDYLGHSSIATTNRYITTNIETKRRVLQSFWARSGLDHRSSTRWNPSPKLLAFLSSL